MPYAGKQVAARDIAREARNYWQNYELTKAVATCLAESKGSVGAYNDNDNETRDCGAYQINIPGSKVGTATEFNLRTESFEVDTWLEVFQNNVGTAFDMYSRAWVRDGHQDIRRWQAWYAYTTGWAMFPQVWVWRHAKDENDELVPVGPWVPTGRYIHKAIAGQMNNLVVNEKIWTADVALSYGLRYAKHFGIDDGSVLHIEKDKFGRDLLVWKYPKSPTSPPADGVGPRPVKNDGA